MIRLLLLLAIAGGLAFCGSTVQLGNRTFFGHVRAIWGTDEVQDLKDGVTEKAGPAASKVKKGVEAGYKAMTEDEKKAAAESDKRATSDDAKPPTSGSAAGSGTVTKAP